jgi:hypothetical protein
LSISTCGRPRLPATAPKPSEFGATGAYWNNEEWLLPEKYSPIRAFSGDGNQGVYLAATPHSHGSGVRTALPCGSNRFKRVDR